MGPPPFEGELGLIAVPTVYCAGSVAYARPVGAATRISMSSPRVVMPDAFVAVIVYVCDALITVGVPSI